MSDNIQKDPLDMNPEKKPCCKTSLEPILLTLVFIGGGISWYALNYFLG